MPANMDSNKHSLPPRDFEAEGYLAYTVGEKLENNPATGEDARQWANGWAWARTDHIKANRKAAKDQR